MLHRRQRHAQRGLRQAGRQLHSMVERDSRRSDRFCCEDRVHRKSRNHAGENFPRLCRYSSQRWQCNAYRISITAFHAKQRAASWPLFVYDLARISNAHRHQHVARLVLCIRTFGPHLPCRLRVLELLEDKREAFDEYARRSDMANAVPDAVDTSSEAELRHAIVAAERTRLKAA